eukprot:TRINITY_DN37745_c0_g1_i1.p1 TRINITY_DN37745_c0_g1~~TRINITY_DN37745_c0_g1_i1.p1  ORF type:complete len:340 (-),score=49.48 TRINITY_DN37745_c0_g1_i1:39-1058(-)
MEVSLRGLRLSPMSCRFLSTSSIVCRRGQGSVFSKGALGKEDDRKDAATILEEERNGVFRVLDIGKPRAETGRMEDNRRRFAAQKVKLRHTEMKPDADWGSIWPAARTFHPAVVPLPVRQGIIQIKKQVVPSKYANTELMKIPNFLHLTPPVIKKHCGALRKFCSAWPVGLHTDEDIQKHFPIKVTTSDYLNSSSSIRDRRSRVVVLRFKLASLSLDDHARDKFIRLVGDRYDHESDEVTLTTDRCPYRGQNIDYAKYLMTALYFESWKTESWEVKDYADKESFEVVEIEEGEKGKYMQCLKDILNAGEDDISLRQYKEAARKVLNLPTPTAKTEIVNN